MLEIIKSGNAIVVNGTENSMYPRNGKLTYPLNSIICVVDESDIVTFRSASNNDVLFSAKVDELTIGGQGVTKVNVGSVFGALSNAAAGGGGGGTSDYNDLTNKPTINGQELVGDVTITQPTKVSELENDEGYATCSDVDQAIDDINIGQYATKNWVDDKGYLTQHQDISGKADKSEIPTHTSDLINDSGFLTELQSLDNYYNKTEVNGLIDAISTFKVKVVAVLPTEGIDAKCLYLVANEGSSESDVYNEYIYVEGKWELIGSTKADLSDYYTKAEIDNKFSKIVWSGTQEEYNALSDKTEYQIYLIKDGGEV